MTIHRRTFVPNAAAALCATAARAARRVYPGKLITALVDIPFVVVTKPDAPARNLGEFIEHAEANPGKISFADAGVGTQAHLAHMMFGPVPGLVLP